MLRIACGVSRNRTAPPSASESSEIICRLGRKRRFVLLLAWLTLLPTWTPLPVMMHLRAMAAPRIRSLWQNAARGLVSTPSSPVASSRAAGGKGGEQVAGGGGGGAPAVGDRGLGRGEPVAE